MDGLSAAASGIAVVSLAIQLVDSVREIRRFLRDVSEAPKELKRLIDLLEQLELILENIGALVESQQQGAEQPVVDLSASILKAMKTCESKLKMLEDVVETAKKSANATNKASRKFGDFRLACKRKDIEDFERQVHDAISLLNLVLTTNLTIVHSQSMGHLLEKVTTTHQMTSTFSNNLLLLTNSADTDTSYGLSATAVARIRSKNRPARPKLAKRREIVVSRFSGLFGRLLIRKEVRNSAFEEEKGPSDISHTQSESTWIFIPSFLSYAFDFRYLNTCGSVERTLRTYPTIEESHPVWKMCKNGNLLGIQKLLSAGQISPFCVDEYGWTLLHTAAWCCQAQLYEFLLEVGLTGEELNVGGYSCYGIFAMYKTPKHPHAVERMLEVILERANLSDVSSSHLELFSSIDLLPPVSMFISMVQKLLTVENINDCLCPPLAIVARMFPRSDPCQRHFLKAAIQHLVALGADLHRGSEVNFTLLEDLFSTMNSPWDSNSVGRVWLDILKESGVDVVEYLRAESSLPFNSFRSAPMLSPGWLTGLRDRYLIISEEPPSVSWDWFIDPGENAYEVLEEFKNLGPGWHDIYDDFHYPSFMYNWPYSYPAWHWLAIRQSRGDLYGENIARARHYEERFERRWHKKAMKLARAQGVTHRGPRMPGSWID